MGMNDVMVITREIRIHYLASKHYFWNKQVLNCFEYLRDFVSNVIVWWGGKFYGKTCFCILWGSFSLNSWVWIYFWCKFYHPRWWKPWKLDLWIQWKWFLPPDALTCWTFCTYHLMWQGPSYLRWWFGHVYRRSIAGQSMWDESKG